MQIFLIVDDYEPLRRSLTVWLKSQFPDYLYFEAKSGEEAVTLALMHKPAIVLMDISLPKMNGIEATRLIKNALPETKVIMLSVHEDQAYQKDALHAGAHTYIFKRNVATELFPLLRKILS